MQRRVSSPPNKPTAPPKRPPREASLPPRLHTPTWSENTTRSGHGENDFDLLAGFRVPHDPAAQGSAGRALRTDPRRLQEARDVISLHFAFISPCSVFENMRAQPSVLRNMEMEELYNFYETKQKKDAQRGQKGLGKCAEGVSGRKLVGDRHGGARMCPPPRVPVRVTCVLSRPGGGRGLLALGNKGFRGDGDEDRDRTKEPRVLRHLSMEKVPLNPNCQRAPDGRGRCRREGRAPVWSPVGRP